MAAGAYHRILMIGPSAKEVAVLKKYRWTFRVCTKLPDGKHSKPKVRTIIRTCRSLGEAKTLCEQARAAFQKANMLCGVVDEPEEVT